MHIATIYCLDLPSYTKASGTNFAQRLNGSTLITFVDITLFENCVYFRFMDESKCVLPASCSYLFTTVLN